MYTGIVDHYGKIFAVETNQKNSKIWVQTSFRDFQMGESISVDGICLTVVEFDETKFAGELSPETMRLTIANQYNVHHCVNLERSLRFSDRLGGHMVSGHVDETLYVRNIISHEEFTEMEFAGVSLDNENTTDVTKPTIIISTTRPLT